MYASNDTTYYHALLRPVNYSSPHRLDHIYEYYDLMMMTYVPVSKKSKVTM
jgi:hypothetical protein